MNRTLKKRSNTCDRRLHYSLSRISFRSVIALLLCGVWDVSRNRDLDAGVRQYFLQNGIGTWLASPLNIVMDILALPYLNKGVYEIDDLPPHIRAEIGGLLRTADNSGLAERVERHMAAAPRAMMFFKWYGRNVDAPIEMSEFHEKYKFIRTIGVSVFRERESTSRHFGPFRPSLRVLYCLNKDLAETRISRSAR